MGTSGRTNKTIEEAHSGLGWFQAIKFSSNKILRISDWHCFQTLRKTAIVLRIWLWIGLLPQELHGARQKACAQDTLLSLGKECLQALDILPQLQRR